MRRIGSRRVNSFILVAFIRACMCRHVVVFTHLSTLLSAPLRLGPLRQQQPRLGDAAPSYLEPREVRRSVYRTPSGFNSKQKSNRPQVNSLH